MTPDCTKVKASLKKNREKNGKTWTQQQLLSALAPPASHTRRIYSPGPWILTQQKALVYTHTSCAELPVAFLPWAPERGPGGSPGSTRKSCAVAELARRGGKHVKKWRGFVFCKQKEVHFLYYLTIAPLCAKTCLELLKYLHLFLHLPNLFIEPSGKHWLFIYEILWSFLELLHQQNSLKTPPPTEIVNYNQISGLFLCICVFKEYWQGS